MKFLSGVSRFGVARYLVLVLLAALLASWLLAACGETTKPATFTPTTTATPVQATTAVQAATVLTTAAANTATTAPTAQPTQTTVPATTAPVATNNTAAATTAPAVVAATGNADAGKKVFMEQCSGCHGAAAMGSYGPKIAATKLTYEEVLAQVRNPKNRGQNIMTPFSPSEVSDQQVRDIYAFLQSLR